MPYDEVFYDSALEVQPYYTLDDVVSDAADHFSSSWKKFWGIDAADAPDHLDPDDWKTANELHAIASRIYRAAVSLLDERLPRTLRERPSLLEEEARDEKLGRERVAEELRQRAFEEGRTGENWDGLKDLLEESFRLQSEEGEAEKRVKLFQTAVQVYAYPDFGSPPAQVASRLLDLLEFLVRTKGERTRQYLTRVASCYVRGMLPELAVMARAVMEAALKGLPSVDERLGQQASGRRANLADRIEAAVREGILDTEGRIAAGRIIEAGNHAIHRRPQLALEAHAILADLRLVLTQVQGYEEGRD